MSQQKIAGEQKPSEGKSLTERLKEVTDYLKDNLKYERNQAIKSENISCPTGFSKFWMSQKKEWAKGIKKEDLNEYISDAISEIDPKGLMGKSFKRLTLVDKGAKQVAELDFNMQHIGGNTFFIYLIFLEKAENDKFNLFLLGSELEFKLSPIIEKITKTDSGRFLVFSWDTTTETVQQRDRDLTGDDIGRLKAFIFCSLLDNVQQKFLE